MKIQILGSPRSGTTSLYKALRETLNYTMGIFEPLNPYLNYKVINNIKIQNHISIVNNCKANIVEKNVISNDKSNLTKDEFDEILNFYINYFQHFDKIILLYRKNLNDQAKSYATAIKYGTWHIPYNNIEINYQKQLSIIKTNNEIITNLSNYFKIPLTYYEDLYSNNSTYLNNLLKYYNIEINNQIDFYSIMNPKNRLLKTQ